MRAILTLHSVDRTGSVLSISPEQLDSLLSSVSASGHRIVPLRDLLDGGEADRIALSFDDGFRSILEEGARVLDLHRAPATIFAVTGYLGGDNGWPTQPADAPVFPTLRWEDLAELRDRGFVVESHSVNHPDLTQLEPAALEQELLGARAQLADRLGVQSEVFAYPYGFLDARVLRSTGAHYRYAVTTRLATLEDPIGDPLQVPRVDAYYLREPRVHRNFGRRRFAAYLATRASLRKLRRHPGEVRV
jgi:peptidoglycan/xylan/chitin deacetylase (PgdA/CDA1 family)